MIAVGIWKIVIKNCRNYSISPLELETVSAPKLVILNRLLAKEIGLDAEALMGQGEITQTGWTASMILDQSANIRWRPFMCCPILLTTGKAKALRLNGQFNSIRLWRHLIASQKND